MTSPRSASEGSQESSESSGSLSPTPAPEKASLERAAPTTLPKRQAEIPPPTLPSLQARQDTLQSRIHEKRSLLVEVNLRRQEQELYEEERLLDS